MLAKATSGPKGTTAHAAKAGMMVMMGPNKNKGLLAAVGKMISLVSNLSASAIGCNKPKGPVRLGPNRIWVKPMAKAPRRFALLKNMTVSKVRLG
jgi:hypothetical protein